MAQPFETQTILSGFEMVEAFLSENLSVFLKGLPILGTHHLKTEPFHNSGVRTVTVLSKKVSVKHP
jgi:hypothetical protein